MFWTYVSKGMKRVHVMTPPSIFSKWNIIIVNWRNVSNKKSYLHRKNVKNEVYLLIGTCQKPYVYCRTIWPIFIQFAYPTIWHQLELYSNFRLIWEFYEWMNKWEWVNERVSEQVTVYQWESEQVIKWMGEQMRRTSKK